MPRKDPGNPEPLMFPLIIAFLMIMLVMLLKCDSRGGNQQEEEPTQDKPTPRVSNGVTYYR